MTDREELASKSLSELLDLLEPFPEPPPISYWPQTEAWAGLLVLVLLVVCVLAWGLVRRRSANAYRRAALSELAAFERDPGAQAALLRRTALVAFPRREVAHLVGEEWLAFLDETQGRDSFRTPLGRALIAAAYSDATAPEDGISTGSDTRLLVATWIRRHRSERPRSAA